MAARASRRSASTGPGQRTLRTLKYGVAQVRILRQRYPAVMHLAIFWTMVLFFIGTVLGSLDTDVFELIFNVKLLKGDFYLLEKVVLDLAALFALVGLGLAIYRRYVVRPDRLNTDWRFNLTLPLLAFIVLTGLFVEALRLAALQPAWAPFSVIAYPISLLFRGGMCEGLQPRHQPWHLDRPFPRCCGRVCHPAVHQSVPHLHLAGQHLLRAVQGQGRTEADPRPGAGRAARRQEADRFPLAATGELRRLHRVRPLPGGLPGLRGQAAAQPEEAGARSARRVDGFRGDAATRDAGNGGRRVPRHPVTTSQLVGDVIKHETLWACTTCYGCVYECPVLIEHVDAIVDMRRYLALIEGDIPASLATTLTNIERAGNPWKQPKRKRAAWAQGLDFEVPIMASVGEGGSGRALVGGLRRRV